MAEDGHDALESLSLEKSWRRFVLVLRTTWYVVVVLALAGSGLAVTVSVLETPQYDSTAVMYVTSGSGDSTQTAYQGSLASQQRVASYAKLATSNLVLETAVKSAGASLSADELRRLVVASTTPETVLLSVRVRYRDPAVAAALANAVASSMSSFVRELETPSGGGEPLAKLTVVTPAVASESAATPRTARNIVIGALAGLLVGVLCVAIRARFDTRIRSADDAESELGVPVLSVVPKSRKFAGSSMVDFSSGSSAVAEAFRKLRTNLRFVEVSDALRVVLVTSPNEGEGKTTTALNLAAALGEAGVKALVVDGDIRRPAVASRVGVEGGLGLTTYLQGGVELTDVIQRCGTDTFDVLAAGEVPPNPSELLGSKAAADLFVALAERYEYVIVDSPPILPVTDAVVTAANCDGVLLVLRSQDTTRSEALSAMSQLAKGECRVAGVVLNGIEDRGAYYGDHYGYVYSAQPASM